MFTIEFYNNEISKKEKYKCATFKECLHAYLEMLTLPWWEADISELKILKDNKNITKKVNKFLEG